MGGKGIKRGRLGGGAHEGEAFRVFLCSKWQVSCHHDVLSGPASITPALISHNRFSGDKYSTVHLEGPNYVYHTVGRYRWAVGG